MPRTAIAISALVANDDLADPAGTALDPVNQHSLAAAGSTRDLILRVTNTAGAAKNFIVKHGVNPPAFREALGDLTISVGIGATVFIGPLDMARFVQADGTVNIDLEAASAGTVTAFRVPVA